MARTLSGSNSFRHRFACERQSRRCRLDIRNAPETHYLYEIAVAVNAYISCTRPRSLVYWRMSYTHARTQRECTASTLVADACARTKAQKRTRAHKLRYHVCALRFESAGDNDANDDDDVTNGWGGTDLHHLHIFSAASTTTSTALGNTILPRGFGKGIWREKERRSGSSSSSRTSSSSNISVGVNISHAVNCVRTRNTSPHAVRTHTATHSWRVQKIKVYGT